MLHKVPQPPIEKASYLGAHNRGLPSLPDRETFFLSVKTHVQVRVVKEVLVL